MLGNKEHIFATGARHSCRNEGVSFPKLVPTGHTQNMQENYNIYKHNTHNHKNCYHNACTHTHTHTHTHTILSYMYARNVESNTSEQRAS